MVIDERIFLLLFWAYWWSWRAHSASIRDPFESIRNLSQIQTISTPFVQRRGARACRRSVLGRQAALSASMSRPLPDGSKERPPAATSSSVTPSIELRCTPIAAGVVSAADTDSPDRRAAKRQHVTSPLVIAGTDARARRLEIDDAESTRPQLHGRVHRVGAHLSSAVQAESPDEMELRLLTRTPHSDSRDGAHQKHRHHPVALRRPRRHASASRDVHLCF